MKPTLVSIYSGAGGIDIGFKSAGFTSLLATDNWEPACLTLKKNKISKTVLCEDIRKIDFAQYIAQYGYTEIDCLIGGPPCPAYSKSRFYLKNKKRAMEDENAYTLSEYFRAVKEMKPKVFLFENVFGFTYKPHHEAFTYLVEESKNLGYNISYKVVNCANYGIPQIRERFFCVGTRDDLPVFTFPDETHGNPSKPLKEGVLPWVTAGDVLNDIDFDLPEDVNMEAGSRHKDLLKLVPPGENYLYFTKERGHPDPQFIWRSRYWSFLLKLSPDKPSWTIQASHSNNMGPFHWKNRFLRISEIKRIQTFPDNYEITGDFRNQWRQVGNAVPAKMAEILAQSIQEQYFDK